MSAQNWNEEGTIIQGDLLIELEKGRVYSGLIELLVYIYSEKWDRCNLALEYRFGPTDFWKQDAHIVSAPTNYIDGNKLYGLKVGPKGYLNKIVWNFEANQLNSGYCPQIRMQVLPTFRQISFANNINLITEGYGDHQIDFIGKISNDKVIGIDNFSRYIVTNGSNLKVLSSSDFSNVLWEYDGVSNPFHAMQIYSGDYIVADTDNNRVIQLDENLNNIKKTYTVFKPQFIDFSEYNESLLITVRSPDSICEVTWSINSDPSIISSFSLGLNDPSCATYSKVSVDRVIISDTGNNRVIIWDKLYGTYEIREKSFYQSGNNSFQNSFYFYRPFRSYETYDGKIIIIEEEGQTMNFDLAESSSSSSSSIDSSSSSSSSSIDSSSSSSFSSFSSFSSESSSSQSSESSSSDSSSSVSSISSESSESSSSSIDSSSSTSSLSSDSSESSSSSFDLLWTPGVLKGLSAWYDASDVSSLPDSSIEPGGFVYEWGDISGNGHYLRDDNNIPSSGAGAIISSLGGLRALKFDGLDDSMSTLSGNAQYGNPLGEEGMASGDLSLFFVTKTESINTQGVLFSNYPERFLAHAPWSSNSIIFDVGGSTAPNRITAPNWSVVNEELISNFYVSPTENVQEVWKNGSVFVQDTSGETFTVGDRMVIGGGGGIFQNVTIGEVLVVQGVVSDNDREKVEGYLAHKWGLEGNLPIGHPYKDYPPVFSPDPKDTIVYDNVPIPLGEVDRITGDPHQIPDDWKRNNTDIDELQIGINCIHIGSYAFYYCSGLTGPLTIPNSVTSIGGLAFFNCAGFTGSLTIPNSVTSIGSSAFYFCSGFDGPLTIPDSVTTIGNYVFGFCSGFTGTLTIPNSVTTIESYAFLNCTGFTGSLTIPNSVTTIGNGAFQGCIGFTGSLTIPDSVTTIGDFAFYNCNQLTGPLTIPNSVTTIGSIAFVDCTGFTGSLTIPNSVTSIGSRAFYNCSGLTNVNCYVTKTIFDQTNVLLNSGVTTIHVRSTDVTWTPGGPQTIGGKSGITVIKDL